MNTRRKFLIQGGLATTALIAAKPLHTIAGVSSPMAGFGSNHNSVLFLHTADHQTHQLVNQIAELKRTAHNVVVLNAGNMESATDLKYDASINKNNAVAATANNYRIIYKGNIKIGVITATAGNNVINNINSLSTHLKKDKNCHLVVCLSQLGYKQKHGIDDVTLAANTEHLDIIIGGDAKNNSKNAVVVLNKNRSEVIIDHAADRSPALGKIEIAFNDRGQKWNIAI